MIEAQQNIETPISDLLKKTEVGVPLMLELVTAFNSDPLAKQAYDEALKLHQNLNLTNNQDSKKQNLHFKFVSSRGVELIARFYLDNNSNHSSSRISIHEFNLPFLKNVGVSIDETEFEITNISFHAGNLKDSFAAEVKFREILSEFFGQS